MVGGHQLTSPSQYSRLQKPRRPRWTVPRTVRRARARATRPYGAAPTGQGPGPGTVTSLAVRHWLGARGVLAASQCSDLRTQPVRNPS